MQYWTWNFLWEAAGERNFADLVFNSEEYRPLPPFEEMKKYNQNPEWHPEGDTVFDHVVAALNRCVGYSPLVQLGVLFHDIGKPATAEPSPKGPWYRFYDHDEVGERVFSELRDQYLPDMPVHIARGLKYVIRNHSRFWKIPEMKEYKVLNLVHDPWWGILESVAACDWFCRNTESKEKNWQAILNRVQALYDSGQLVDEGRALVCED